MTEPHIPSAGELRRLFAERGIRPNRGRGQNFLVDANLMRFVVRAAELGRRDVVLEAGAGTGALTGLLAAHAGAVIAVEVDRKLHAIAAETLAVLSNVRLIHADVMGPGETLAPEARQAVVEALAAIPGSRFKVVANLPYRISTALIAALLPRSMQPSALLQGLPRSMQPPALLQGTAREPIPCDMVVTVQREVADRICASPGSEDYGYLSVLVQAVSRATRLKMLSPKAFWPQPEVDSVILRIRPDPALHAAAGDLDKLRRVAGALFTHRRKQAASSLVREGLVRDRAGAARLLSDIGASDAARPEELAVEQFIQLARHLL